MKFHKLVKSIDFVTYPALIEIRRISNSIDNSLANLANILFSICLGILLEKTLLSEYLIGLYLEHGDNEALLEFCRNNNNAGTILAISLVVISFILLKIGHWIKVRFINNKDSINKRKLLAHRFYKEVIPKLISVKSIMEHCAETEESKKDKRFLFLVQANHEIIELINLLSQLRIVETNCKRCITAQSEKVLKLIGKGTYFAVLSDILVSSVIILVEMKNHTGKVTELESNLVAALHSSHTFKFCIGLTGETDPYYYSFREKYDNVKDDDSIKKLFENKDLLEKFLE